MKKLLAFIIIITSVFAVSARDKISRNINVLPIAAQTVLKNNFKAGISFIKIDKNMMGSVDEYEVVLDDGSEITFDKNGNWKEVEVRSNKSVPSAFVLKEISNYVKQNQKNSKIVGIEKDRNGFTVDLANGVEIKFDKNGKFSRYD